MIKDKIVRRGVARLIGAGLVVAFVFSAIRSIVLNPELSCIWVGLFVVAMCVIYALVNELAGDNKDVALS